MAGFKLGFSPVLLLPVCRTSPGCWRGPSQRVHARTDLVQEQVFCHASSMGVGLFLGTGWSPRHPIVVDTQRRGSDVLRAYDGGIRALGAPCRPPLMSLVTFTRNAVSNFKSTAAVAPSSRHLAHAMVEPLRRQGPRVVVEFGPGTGVMTRRLLRMMPPDGVLLAFEISPLFVDYLRTNIDDKRLHIVAARAETAAAELDRRGIDTVNGVVSSLGIGFLDEEAVGAIFQPLLPRFSEEGTLTQFQYVHRIRMAGRRLEYFDAGDMLRRYFESVESNCVWRNLPPANVITCRGARNGGAP